MIVNDHGLGGMLKEKYTDGIDREKMKRATARMGIVLSLVQDGLISHEDAADLLAGKPIRSRPWWQRLRRWIRGRMARR